MISEAMSSSINAQINAELYSAYLYYAMSAWATDAGYPGTATWLFAQGSEELTHAQGFMTYLNRVGARVVLSAIEAPPKDFDSLKAVFDKVLAHERMVTGRINDLASQAAKEHDHATGNFLQWYVNEQVEEEESVNDILVKLDLIGDARGGLFMLDRELGMRGGPPAKG